MPWGRLTMGEKKRKQTLRYTQVQREARGKEKELLRCDSNAYHCSCFPHGKDPLLFQRHAAPGPVPQPRATSWTTPPSSPSSPGAPGVRRPCSVVCCVSQEVREAQPIVHPYHVAAACFFATHPLRRTPEALPSTTPAQRLRLKPFSP